MSIVQLGALAKTQATYNEQGEELTPAVYYSNPETGEPWYHVDATYLLDVPEQHQVTPQPHHVHEFAGVPTYHYRFESEQQFYELVPQDEHEVIDE